MWEYSVTFNHDREEIVSSFFKIVKKEVLKYNGIIVLTKQFSNSKIVIAVEKTHKQEMEICLLKAVSYIICNFYKEDFLDKHLCLTNKDEMSMMAFKKALINFDKETDYFIISKNLTFESNLFLTSFYKFKLTKLRDKWQELVKLANENREYLISTDAFNDLLKFLIDNLDICKDEIDVVEDENENYYVCDNGNKGETMEGKDLISLLIDMSPQKINVYCKNENHALELMRTIFDKRLNINFSKPVREIYTNISPFSKL